MSSCINCGCAITRKRNGTDLMKFCNNSCSNSHNNKQRARKFIGPLLPAECISCGIKRASPRSVVCKSCKNVSSVSVSKDITIGYLRDIYSIHQYHSKIRGYARTWYSGPKECFVCSYSIHVEICHIIDLNKFGREATLGVVNSSDNLVALCRNHHWEFDNGYIKI